MGVTGGTPLGFDIGADSRGGSTLKGLDLVSFARMHSASIALCVTSPAIFNRAGLASSHEQQVSMAESSFR